MKIIESVQSLLGRKQSVQLSLAQLITLVADKPSIENRNAFYHSLLLSKVGTRIPNPSGTLQSGISVTTQENQVSLPMTTGPDGATMILVCCDIPRMAAVHPEDTFIELDGPVVLKMAEKKNFGIIVQNLLDGKESWAGVPKEHVAEILAGNYGSV